jgi:hypothetical protein
MSNSNTPIPQLGILDESVYSKRRFIEYITNLLKQEDELIVDDEFEAGNKLQVDTETLPGGVGKKVTYRYQEVVVPVGNVTQFTAEYGKAYSSGELSIALNVTRKTYPLKEILFPQSIPAVNEDQAALSGYSDGQTYTANVTNLNAVDGNATVLASGGSYKDINNNGGSLVSSINRQTRHFYGIVTNLEVPDNATILSLNSNLGSLPGSISVDHGAVPTRLCIVTTNNNVVVTASGFEVGMQKWSSQIINPYAADPSYEKSYNIYIQTQGTFNPFTYKIN